MVRSDFSRRHYVEGKRHRAIPTGRRDDGFETRYSCGSYTHRWYESGAESELENGENGARPNRIRRAVAFNGHRLSGAGTAGGRGGSEADRKSTRLNSSH